MKHFRSKGFHFTWMFAIIAAGAALFYIEKHYNPIFVDVPIPTLNNQITAAPATTNNKNSSATTPIIKSSFLLAVPFTPQAPTGNWDELHNEACEEASSIMAYAYFSGMKDTTLKPEFVEAELAKITDWEKKTFGYYLDINSEETAQLIQNFYGLHAKIITSYTDSQLKQELTQNHVIILAANGQLLGNPNYRQPGPPYHMLVIKGWNSQGFITNDPGTRKGLNYPYTFQTLFNAGGDWDHTINAVDRGRKTAVVVWK